MQVLIYEPSYLRLRAQLDAFAGIEFVRMQEDGSLRLGDQPLEAPAIEVAWFDRALYDAGPTREFMVCCLKSPGLQWIQSAAAGFDHPVFAKLLDKGVALSNSHASAIGIAEFVVSAVLDLFQPHARRRELQLAKQWERASSREVCGTTWMIVGIGHIGTEVAVRAKAFGAHVIGVRRSPKGDEPADRVVTPDQLFEWLPPADVVVLAAPANRETQRLVDARFLAAMKPRSVLVNVGRGSVVDETALLAALDQGSLEAAVLDVFETEPLPAESPLWTHPRVRLSAHDAANSDGFGRRSDALFFGNLARYIAGEKPLGLVDAELVKS